MNEYAATQLAEYRRQQLTADATYYRETRARRVRSGSHRRRPLAAFHSWVAAGQL